MRLSQIAVAGRRQAGFCVYSAYSELWHISQDLAKRSTRCHMLAPERPEAVLPDRALYLPTFSHLLIVHKDLEISLSLSLACALSLLYLPTFSHLLIVNKTSLGCYLSQSTNL